MKINHNGFFWVNVDKENVFERNFVPRCIQEMIRNFKQHLQIKMLVAENRAKTPRENPVAKIFSFLI